MATAADGFLLFTAFGTLGDIRPLLAMAAQAQASGRAVLLVSTSRHRRLIEGFGVPFASIGCDTYLDDKAARRGFADRDDGSYNFWKAATLDTLEIYCERLRSLAPGAVGIIAPTFVLSAAIVAEVEAIPLLSVCYSPAHILRRHWALKKGASMIEIRKRINAVRASLGLRSRVIPQLDGIVMAKEILGLYPPMLDQPPDAYIRSPTPVGYPTLHIESVSDLPPGLQDWMEEQPFIMFSFGSYIDADAPSFFEAAAQACRRVGMRGLYASPFSADVLTHPPSHMRVEHYLPHHLTMPHASVVVHHGGTGTLASACEAGRPMVVAPYSHDQPYNAAMLKGAGLAEVIDPQGCDPDTLERVLRTILANQSAFRSYLKSISLGIGPHIAAKAVEAIPF